MILTISVGALFWAVSLVAARLSVCSLAFLSAHSFSPGVQEWARITMISARSGRMLTQHGKFISKLIRVL